MKSIQTKTYCMIGLMLVNFLISGCGQKKDAAANSQPSDFPQIKTVSPIMIKGFTMGMNKVNARYGLHALGLATIRTQFSPTTFGLYPDGKFTCDEVVTNGGNLALVYDSDNKLVHVEMWGSMVDWLFNVGDLDLKSFAKMFLDEYQIGTMEPFNRGNIAGWRHRDDNQGIEIVIYSGSYGGKRMTFRAVPKAIQRKFN